MVSIKLLMQEFEEISKTKFWEAYLTEFRRAEDTVKDKLYTGKVDTLSTYGTVYQEQLAMLKRIENIPKKIFRDAEEKEKLSG